MFVIAKETNLLELFFNPKCFPLVKCSSLHCTGINVQNGDTSVTGTRDQYWKIIHFHPTPFPTWLSTSAIHPHCWITIPAASQVLAYCTYFYQICSSMWCKIKRWSVDIIGEMCCSCVTSRLLDLSQLMKQPHLVSCSVYCQGSQQNESKTSFLTGRLC